MTTLREHFGNIRIFDGFQAIRQYTHEINTLTLTETKYHASNLEKIKSLTQSIDMTLQLLWAQRIEDEDVSR